MLSAEFFVPISAIALQKHVNKHVNKTLHSQSDGLVVERQTAILKVRVRFSVPANIFFYVCWVQSEYGKPDITYIKFGYNVFRI